MLIKKTLQRVIFNDVVMIGLAFLSAFLLVYEIVSNHNPIQTKIIQDIDLGIALVFLTEFIFNFFTAENKIAFLKKYWWEVLAAIPITNYTTQFLRTINLVRIFPLIETLRFIRFIVRLRLMIEASQKITKHTFLIYTFLVITSIITSGALSFYYFEYGHNPNVHNLWDSFWWVIVTVSTIGYGDIYPVTTGGRIIAIMLIIIGIGALGAMIALVDSLVIKKVFDSKKLPNNIKI